MFIEKGKNIEILEPGVGNKKKRDWDRDVENGEICVEDSMAARWTGVPRSMHEAVYLN